MATKLTSTWAELQSVINVISEQECHALLEKEAQGPNRQLWKMRLYQRYSRLRRDREHKQYQLKAVGNAKAKVGSTGFRDRRHKVAA